MRVSVIVCIQYFVNYRAEARSIITVLMLTKLTPSELYRSAAYSSIMFAKRPRSSSPYDRRVRAKPLPSYSIVADGECGTKHSMLYFNLCVRWICFGDTLYLNRLSTTNIRPGPSIHFNAGRVVRRNATSTS